MYESDDIIKHIFTQCRVSFSAKNHIRCARAGKSMYESDEIIKYMFTQYGDGDIPGVLTAGFFTTLSAGLGNIGR